MGIINENEIARILRENSGDIMGCLKVKKFTVINSLGETVFQKERK